MTMSTVRAWRPTMMEASTRDNTKRVKSTVLEFCMTLRVEYIAEAFMRTNYRAKAHINGWMVNATRETGVRTRCMDME
jgi:hypothetical protein